MPPQEHDDLIARVRQTVVYYKRAIASMGVGAQPPTIYAEKYVEDVEALLALVLDAKPADSLAVSESQLELALRHDEVGRVERKSKRK